jgi:hypothetical protein
MFAAVASGATSTPPTITGAIGMAAVIAELSADSCLNEQGWHPDGIELQLAHKERNNVRAAYNRAERMAERKKMMQAWADYLDGC